MTAMYQEIAKNRDLKQISDRTKIDTSNGEEASQNE